MYHFNLWWNSRSLLLITGSSSPYPYCKSGSVNFFASVENLWRVNRAIEVNINKYLYEKILKFSVVCESYIIIIYGYKQMIKSVNVEVLLGVSDCIIAVYVTAVFRSKISGLKDLTLPLLPF